MAGQILQYLRRNNWSVQDTRQILSKITEYVNSGSRLTNEMVKLFSNKIISHYFNGRRSICLYEEPEILQEIENILNEGHKLLDPETSVIIMTYQNNMIVPIMNTYNFEINESFITFFQRNDIQATNTYKNIFELCNIKINDNEKIFKYQLNIFVINHLIDKRHVTINQNIVYKVIELYGDNILEKVLHYGGTLDNTLLEKVCETTNICMYSIIRFLFNNGILPSEVSFNKLINNKDITYYLDICVKIFLEHDYRITYEQLLILTSRKIKINNIDKYELKLDNRYLEICDKINFYPYPFGDIKQEDIDLMSQCTPHSKIKSNIVPKQICMKLACTYKNNLNVLETLTQLGGKIDLDCLQKTIELHTSNRQVSYVFEKFKETFLKEYKPIDTIEEPMQTKRDIDIEIVPDKELNPDLDKELNSNIEIISLIPKDFDIYKNIYEMITTNIKTILGITKKEINYLEFRKCIMNYINDNNCVKCYNITVPDELKYNDTNEITIKHIDNWVYGLLKYENKYTEIVNTKRVRKTRIVKKN